jgi:hypothetical protein
MLTRETILKALKDALEPLDYVHAMWEGGAAAFDRVDQWSDIDLQVVADDDRVQDVLALVDQVLASLSPIELRYELPQPTWHGHWQVFYRLKNAGPFLMLDFVVIKLSNPKRFLESEIHGDAPVHFDKANIVTPPPFDAQAFADQIKARLETLRVTFDLFQVLTLKELHRGNWIEAISFYQSWTLRPLVEVLRMKYDPTRYNFHTRYVQYVLPPDVMQRLETLFFVSNPDDLRAKTIAAQQWFWGAFEQIDLAEVKQIIGDNAKTLGSN